MGKNKKRLLSVLLVFVMMCSIISPAWAEIPRSEEGYYSVNHSVVQSYISYITIADNDCKYILQADQTERVTRDMLDTDLNNDGDYVYKDLNDGAGGHYIYLGWGGTRDPYSAITGLRLLKWDNDEPPESYIEDGVTWTLVRRAVEGRKDHWVEDGVIYPKIEPEYTDSPVDLNAGAGGDYIYLYYTKDASYGPPLREIEFSESKIELDQFHDPIVRFGDQEWYDVNSGAGGDYIYLYTQTGFYAIDIPRLRDLVEEAKECLDNSGDYVSTNALSIAYEEGIVALLRWGEGKYYTGSTHMENYIPSKIKALEKALAELVPIGSDGNIDNNDSQPEDTGNIEDSDLSIIMQIKNKIMVNGRNINSDAAPIIVDNRAMVPITVLPAMMGGTADWDEATRTVTLNMGGEVFTMTIDQPISDFGTSVVMLNDQIYVPIRYVAEKLGANVEWIASTQQVLIEKWNNL